MPADTIGEVELVRSTLGPSLSDFFVRAIKSGPGREFQVVNRRTYLIEATRTNQIAACRLAEKMQAELDRYRAALAEARGA